MPRSTGSKGSGETGAPAFAAMQLATAWAWRTDTPPCFTGKFVTSPAA